MFFFRSLTRTLHGPWKLTLAETFAQEWASWVFIFLAFELKRYVRLEPSFPSSLLSLRNQLFGLSVSSANLPRISSMPGKQTFKQPKECFQWRTPHSVSSPQIPVGYKCILPRGIRLQPWIFLFSHPRDFANHSSLKLVARNLPGKKNRRYSSIFTFELDDRKSSKALGICIPESSSVACHENFSPFRSWKKAASPRSNRMQDPRFPCSSVKPNVSYFISSTNSCTALFYFFLGLGW